MSTEGVACVVALYCDHKVIGVNSGPRSCACESVFHSYRKQQVSLNWNLSRASISVYITEGYCPSCWIQEGEGHRADRKLWDHVVVWTSCYDIGKCPCRHCWDVYDVWGRDIGCSRQGIAHILHIELVCLIIPRSMSSPTLDIFISYLVGVHTCLASACVNRKEGPPPSACSLPQIIGEGALSQIGGACEVGCTELNIGIASSSSGWYQIVMGRWNSRGRTISTFYLHNEHIGVNSCGCTSCSSWIGHSEFYWPWLNVVHV